MITITLYARQKKRHRCTEQTFFAFSNPKRVIYFFPLD